MISKETKFDLIVLISLFLLAITITAVWWWGFKIIYAEEFPEPENPYLPNDYWNNCSKTCPSPNDDYNFMNCREYCILKYRNETG